MRKTKNGTLPANAHFEEFAPFSKKYILEELAYMAHTADLYPGVEVYPGRFLNVLTSSERHRIKDLPHNLLAFPLVELDFVRNKAYTGGEAGKVTAKALQSVNAFALPHSSLFPTNDSSLASAKNAASTYTTGESKEA